MLYITEYMCIHNMYCNMCSELTVLCPYSDFAFILYLGWNRPMQPDNIKLCVDNVFDCLTILTYMRCASRLCYTCIIIILCSVLYVKGKLLHESVYKQRGADSPHISWYTTVKLFIVFKWIS